MSAETRTAMSHAVFFELEVFRAKGQDLLLQPYPGGKAAASFRATKVEPNMVISSWRAGLKRAANGAEALVSVPAECIRKGLFASVSGCW